MYTKAVETYTVVDSNLETFARMLLIEHVNYPPMPLVSDLLLSPFNSIVESRAEKINNLWNAKKLIDMELSKMTNIDQRGHYLGISRQIPHVIRDMEKDDFPFVNVPSVYENDKPAIARNKHTIKQVKDILNSPPKQSLRRIMAITDSIDDFNNE